jgi:hypothetical protein
MKPWTLNNYRKKLNYDFLFIQTFEIYFWYCFMSGIKKAEKIAKATIRKKISS